jgi:hypothetical protein
MQWKGRRQTAAASGAGAGRGAACFLSASLRKPGKASLHPGIGSTLVPKLNNYRTSVLKLEKRRFFTKKTEIF